MAATPGWRFSVTIPSWTQTALEGDELVVFYRVEVKVLPPEEAAAPRSRSVLRRFSHFQKLYSILREELGAKVMLARAVPAKWSLLGVNKKPELIEKRRKELEVWLWKLIADPDIARSRMLNNFLELTDAARMVTKPRLSPAASSASRNGVGSVASRGDGLSFAASDGTRSDAEETSSEASYAATASTVTGLEQPTQDLRLGSQLLLSPADSGAVLAAQPRGSSPAFADGPDAMRLGLRIEQRAGLRQLTRTLQQRLTQASSDLQDAVAALRTEQRVKRELAARNAELEAAAATAAAREVDEPASPPAPVAAAASEVLRPPSPDEKLQHLLSEERLRTADLQRALQLESGQNTELRDDLTALSAELHRLQTLETEREQAQSQPQPVEPSPVEPAPSLTEAPAASETAEATVSQPDDSAASVEEVQRLRLETEALTQQLQAASEAADSERKAAAEAAAKSRADMKVLAKEVRNLRQQLGAAEAERKAASETQQAAAEAQRAAADAAAAQTEAEARRAAAEAERDAAIADARRAAAEAQREAEAHRAAAEVVRAAAVADAQRVAADAQREAEARRSAAEAECAAAVSALLEAQRRGAGGSQPDAAAATGADLPDAAASVPAAQPSGTEQELGASSRRLLREVAALRSRLAEASAEHMSRPEFPLEAPDSSPSAAREAISSDALNSSDSRLEALQAEAHLLQDSLGGSTSTGPAEAELRRAFAEVLAEVASLRLRNNALLRSSARSPAQPTADGGAGRINGQPPSTDWLKQLTTNGPASAQLMQAKFQDFANRFGKQQQPSGNGSL